MNVFPEGAFRFVVESYFDKELTNLYSDFPASATLKIYYNSVGKCKLTVLGAGGLPAKREELKSGDLIMLAPDTAYRLEIGKTLSRLMMLEFRALKIRENAADSSVVIGYCPDILKVLSKSRYIIINDLEHSKRSISRLHELLNTNRALYLDHVFTQTIINEILLNIEENHTKVHVDHVHLNKIINFIIRRYHEPISLTDISENVGLNLSYMQSFFRKHMGNTVYDYLTEYRIQKAIALIKNTDLTFEDIAYEVGFNTRQSFYNAFHKITGYTPKLFRKYLTYPTVDFINDSAEFED